MIGPQIEVRASVSGSGELRVYGALEGTVDLDGVLNIEDGALLRADAIANQIEISGIAIGQIQAHESIVLRASARVVGSLNAPNIEMVPGAQLRGPIRTAAPERLDEVRAHAASQRKSASRGEKVEVSQAASRAASATHNNRSADDASKAAPKRRNPRRVVNESESTAVVRHPDVSATEQAVEIAVPESESVDAKVPARGKKRAAARR